MTPEEEREQAKVVVHNLQTLRAAYPGPVTVFRCCSRAWSVLPQGAPCVCGICKGSCSFTYTTESGIPLEVVLAELQRLP